MPRVLLHRALIAPLVAIVMALPSSALAAVEIPASRAAEHVDENVTVVGRVVATYASPTATVLAFAPNFAGFTATILAADRGKFPDPEERYRDRMVRLIGTVTAYRGKPEMRLSDPTQIVVVEAPGESPSPGARATLAIRVSPTPDPLAETRQSFAALNDRLDAIEARLAAIEHAIAVLGASVSEPRAPALAVGVSSAAVRATFGDPLRTSRGARGETVWVYDGGRSITFDRNGRVVAWTGF